MVTRRADCGTAFGGKGRLLGARRASVGCGFAAAFGGEPVRRKMTIGVLAALAARARRAGVRKLLRVTSTGMSDEEDVLKFAAERIGSTLHGKYRLDAIVGVGGMAVVYAATHRNQKRFAVKILLPEFSVRGEFRQRFLREGYVANSVAHEGVVDVLDDDVDETGAAFLVMELLDGSDLQSLAARAGGTLPVNLALLVAHQVLGVLAAAHRKAVVHRDIKPANLFLVRSGLVKVLDFGIARLREVNSKLDSTRAGAVLGSPAFMAPEQAAGEAHNVDERSDLWALGASLFTLLSGKYVHDAENGRATLLRAATERARSLAEVAPNVPPSVCALVDKALAFEPTERWQSAAAMREAVAAVQRELFGELSPEPVRAWLAGLLSAAELESTRSARPVTRGVSAPGLVPRPERARRRVPRGLSIAGASCVALGSAWWFRPVPAPDVHVPPSAELAQSRAAAVSAPKAPELAPPVPALPGAVSEQAAPALPSAFSEHAPPPHRTSSTSPPRALLTGLTLNAARAHPLSPASARPLPTSAVPVAAGRAPANPLELELQ
jgi:serine/threonine-protein kinase